MVFLWLFHGFPKAVLWSSYGFPMVFLRLSYGFPMVFLWFLPTGGGILNSKSTDRQTAAKASVCRFKPVAAGIPSRACLQI